MISKEAFEILEQWIEMGAIIPEEDGVDGVVQYSLLLEWKLAMMNNDKKKLKEMLDIFSNEPKHAWYIALDFYSTIDEADYTWGNIWLEDDYDYEKYI